MSLEFVRKLPTPTEIREQYPLSARATEIKKQRDAEIAKVFTGDSDKFLVIVGPCSADNEDAVLEYNHRLAKVADKVSDKLIIIPRVYTNKPRTTGEGYKGIVHQPDPEGKPDLLHGLIAMRKMHMRVVEETDLTSADEMLYPSNWSYLSDILSYVAVGARSVENQEHRLTVSGIDIPAGMKNPTSGDLSVMINSVIAAQPASVSIAGEISPVKAPFSSKYIFSAPIWMLEPFAASTTGMISMAGTQKTTSTSSFATSGFNVLTNSTASLGVMFIFQFLAIIFFLAMIV